MIELKKTKTAKDKVKKHPLYRWARLIAATTWEEVAQESAGNRYMERIQEEMVKMSQDERDRYLYLREEMAASDRVSQLQSAENRGRFIEKISLIQKKIQRGDSVEKIADDLMEDIVVIKKIYEIVKENTKATADEIYQKIN